VSIAEGLRRRARSVASRIAPRRIKPVDSGRRFGPEDIERVRRIYYETGGEPGSPWEPLRDAHLRLPDWFRHGLDPYGDKYLAQQHRLWRMVAGVDRDYEVERDEKEADWSAVDPVRTPGFYARRDAAAIVSASDHVIASGMLMKHSGLQPGDWALEYGPGFGQTALALARLGVNVDTVDVSRTFCGFVQQQAAFFRVPLHAFAGRFGDAPRPGQRYKLVWFYESFHHCLDFQRVVRILPTLLAPGGRVILCGEPICREQNAAVPYPWGLRLHSEVVAVVREHRWFELGFTEAFLLDLFGREGFSVERIECEPSQFGQLYVCQLAIDPTHTEGILA
jgi:SAM-dependent methyltransferase